MYERTRDYLPQSLGAKGENKLVGLNARLRLYRYQPGAIYRPHVDGSWPGSACMAMNITTTILAIVGVV